MLTYLFLAAAIATTPSEIPTTDITSTEASYLPEATKDMEEIQELIAVLTQEETAPQTIVDSSFAQATADTSTDKVENLAEKPASITITNAIEPRMLEYKHWTGKYSPEQFAISVNGTDIQAGKTCEIPASSTTVEIGYTYSFMNGMKSGGRKISYQLNENTTQANITFSWKDDWRVIVDNGKATKEITA